MIRFNRQDVEFRCMADSITEAFAFVMEHLDEVGDNPSISINPTHWCDPEASDEDHEKTRFGVFVGGAKFIETVTAADPSIPTVE